MQEDSLAKETVDVQTLYPRIYMACHTEHVTARSSSTRLSSRDSSVLAHLTVEELQSPTRLAHHLNISLSTLSECTVRLEELGYVETFPDVSDGRKVILKLTQKGTRAMKDSSVLDADKVKALLTKMSPKDRRQAIGGLRLLADAALVLW